MQETAHGTTAAAAGRSGLRQRAEAVERWIDGHGAQSFTILSLIYVAMAVTLAGTKLLWFDELITVHLARLDSMATIWQQLKLGVDPNPPLMPVLVMVCRDVLGEHALAMRLPAIAGFWTGMLALYLFVRRHTSATWALAGAAVLMVMPASQYSYECRSYALLFGLTMAAVYLWVVAADAGSPPGARTAALAGMTLALAAAICSNYFAALAFVTIAAGEAVRTATREDRRVDWRVWAGLAVAASPLLAFRRLMQSSVAVYAPHAWNKVAAGEAWVSYFRMAGSKPACVMAALMAGLAVQRLRGHAKKTSEAGRKMAAHEAAAAGMLLAYPLLGYGVARVYGGMFSSRFVIPVCLGLATAGMVAGYRLLGRTRVAGLAMLGVIATGVGARWKLKEQENVSQKQAFNLLMKQVEQGRRAGEPVVVTDAVLLLPLQQYASPAMAAQMVLPVDFAAVHRHQGDDGAEENLWAGRNGLYPLRMVPLAEFQRTAGSYLIVGERENWLVQELRLHQYPVERVPFYLPPDALRGYLMGLWRSNTVLYRSAGDAGGKGPVGSAVAFEDER